MSDLFSAMEAEDRAAMPWRPQEPPSLAGVPEIALNFETTGLKWADGDLPVAMSVRTSDGLLSRYLPWGHRGGGNLDEGRMKEWLRREAAGKLISNINTRFDLLMARAWGVDLEALGCRFSDAAHWAALLDDSRRKFSLDALAADFLPEIAPVPRLDEARMADYHAGEAAARSEHNVRLVCELKKKLWPELDAQDLQAVRALEDEVIPVVVEMEWNGAPLDVEKLDRWVAESAEEVARCLLEVHRETGLRVNPGSPEDWARLLRHLRIETTALTPTGKRSYADSVLRDLDHPVVRMARRAGHLMDLRSKFLLPYREKVGGDGILRYGLHQLRGDEHGTVRGRFSASDVNVQAVFTKDKQLEVDLGDWVVRELYVPEPGSGARWLRADAKQIEYRLFAHYAASKPILAAYAADPEVSYHRVVWDMIKPYRPDIAYRPVKNINFACVAIDTPILKADLTWAPAGSLLLGDRLLAFDESQRAGVAGRAGARRWRVAEVLGNGVECHECMEIDLDNGETLVATPDHRWVVNDGRMRGAWRRTDMLGRGDMIVKAVDVVKPEMTWPAGWLAGFLDGEGCASKCALILGQNEGPTLAFAEELLRDYYAPGFSKYERPSASGMATGILILAGRVSDRLQLLSRLDPGRMIADFVAGLEGSMFQARSKGKVMAVRNVGLREIAALGTSTETYIAAGYAAHNSMYGAGREKISRMLNLEREESDRFVDLYQRLFPEVGVLLKRAAGLAESRGWVRTLLGRRARFPDPKWSYRALNAIIQGSAADVMKRKLVELHAARAATGLKMRFTVHDEVDGDCPDEACAAKVKEILDAQSFGTLVPILWDVIVGANWAEAK